MTTKKTANPLTPSQLRFVDAYIETLDPLKSAAAAGYAKDTIKDRAKELLKDPRVLAKIHERIELLPAALRINKAFIVKKLLDIVKSASSPEESFDKQGNPSGPKIKDAATALRALDALARCCAQNGEIQQGGDVRVLCIENLNDAKL